MRLAPLVPAVLMLAGCANSVAGTPVTGSGQSLPLVRPTDTAQVLVSPAESIDFLGGRLQIDADRTHPVVGSSAAPACSSLDSVGMAAFVGPDWTGFRELLFTTGDRRGRVVAEAVAIYPDADTAAAAFRIGTKDVNACDGQRALSTGGDADWSFRVGDRASDSVRWTKQQLAVPFTWLCHGEGRLRNNAVMQAMVCGPRGGQALATTLTDRMSANVWELSAR